MATRRANVGNPILVSEGNATPLIRVPFDERTFNEGWFQKLLFEHPRLIPVDDIEPVFGPLVPLARELPTEAGPVDLAYINADGYLTLVETKLWRNPGARREAVAQIIDYAAAMSKWTYDRLADAARKAGASGDDPLIDRVRDQEGFDERRFCDAVAKSLAMGRFLLLIVGDGIRESSEHLAGVVSHSPHLRFALHLLEVGLFRLESMPGAWFVQPRLVARTQEIVRAVVDVRPSAATPLVAVTLPTSDNGTGDLRRREMTEEVFLEKLAGTIGSETAAAFRSFLVDAEEIGVEPQGRDASMSLFWYEPATEQRISFGSVYWQDGRVDLTFVLGGFVKANGSESVGRTYVQTLASLVPGAKVEEDLRGKSARLKIFVGSRPLGVGDLLPRADGWLKAMNAAMAEVASGVER